MEKKDYIELLQIDPSLLKSLDVYKQTKMLYWRIKNAMGQSASIHVTISNTKEIKVHNGTQFSTKIYTSK